VRWKEYLLLAGPGEPAEASWINLKEAIKVLKSDCTGMSGQHVRKLIKDR
jgi:hypothetical protein